MSVSQPPGTSPASLGVLPIVVDERLLARAGSAPRNSGFTGTDRPGRSATRAAAPTMGFQKYSPATTTATSTVMARLTVPEAAIGVAELLAEGEDVAATLNATSTTPAEDAAPAGDGGLAERHADEDQQQHGRRGRGR